jgi:hypothetical protein
MITGEERLRENLSDLYGSVVGYEGRPSMMQVMRTDAINRELVDVTRSFEEWQRRELPRLNALLATKQMKPVP